MEEHGDDDESPNADDDAAGDEEEDRRVEEEASADSAGATGQPQQKKHHANCKRDSFPYLSCNLYSRHNLSFPTLCNYMYFIPTFSYLCTSYTVHKRLLY